MEKQIPKVIHYCWFGRGRKNKTFEQCYKSWVKYCPDYQIIEWNEDNFDLTSNTFVHEAYQQKKWAFISDYARLKILNDFGGIYLDTDVELVKPLDSFLCDKAFSGFEQFDKIPTGIIGSIKNNPWISILLKYYDDRRFVLESGNLDMTTNVEIITRITCKVYNIELNNTKQITEHFIIYPFSFFCAKDHKTGKIKTNKDTVSIHHFSGSWLTRRQKVKHQIVRLMGEKVYLFFYKIKKGLKNKR